MIPLINEEYQSYLNQMNCHICKKSLNMNELMTKMFVKLKIIVNTLVNAEVLDIAHVIQNIVYLKKFQWFFTVNQTMINILS